MFEKYWDGLEDNTNTSYITPELYHKEDLEIYINNHIEELEKYELKSAINIIKKKLRNEDIIKIKNKLLSKGYKSHIVNQAIEELEIN